MSCKIQIYGETLWQPGQFITGSEPWSCQFSSAQSNEWLPRTLPLKWQSYTSNWLFMACWQLKRGENVHSALHQESLYFPTNTTALWRKHLLWNYKFPIDWCWYKGSIFVGSITCHDAPSTLSSSRCTSSNSILYNGGPGPLNGSQFGCQSWLTFSNIGDRGISL